MSGQTTDEIRRRLLHRLSQLNLGGELFDELIGQMMLVSYAAGTTIFHQGSSAELLLWLVKGVAKVYCPFEDASGRVLTRLAGPGDLLGQINSLNGNGHRQLFEAQAASKCEVAVLGRECALRVLQKLEKTQLLTLLDSLHLVWSEALFWYVRLLGLGFRHRLEAVLSDLALRFGVREKRGVLIIPELSQLDLAEMIGSSRPMITRLLKEMSESGELARHGKQLIITPEVAWLNARTPVSATDPRRHLNGDASYHQPIIANHAA